MPLSAQTVGKQKQGHAPTPRFAQIPVSDGQGLTRYWRAGMHHCLPQWDVSSLSRQLLGEQKTTGFLKLAGVQAGKGGRKAGFHGNGSWQERW